MRQVVGIAVVLVLGVATPAIASVKCGAALNDVSAVTGVEAAIAAQCTCCAPPSVYASCIASVVRASIRAKRLSGSCAMKVRRDVGHACPLAGATTTPCQVCNSDADCGTGAFCECRSGSCTKTGGVCVAVPPVCPDLVAPVCGCDGTTYGNDCLRQQAGACKFHSGPCVATGGCFDTIASQCTGEPCSPAAGCMLPNTFCSPACATPPPTGTCFDTLARKCTIEPCGPNQPCLPNQFCVTTCPPPPPSGHCFVTVDGQCSQEACGPGVPCQNPNEFCDPRCGAPACTTDADCDDGNPCTADTCANGACEHACVCTSPTGATACCPGPAATCATPCGTNADGTCGGLCPAADEVCTATGTGCGCTPTTPPACGDTFPTCNGTCPVGSACTSLTGAPSCQCVPAACTTDAECNDNNVCTVDRCVGGVCEHGCICLTPAGASACCPGPGTLCAVPCGTNADGTCGGLCPTTGDVCTDSGGTCTCTPPPPACGDTAPTCNGTCPIGNACASSTTAGTCQCVPSCTPGNGTYFFTCGDPVCGGHRPHDGIPACTTERAGDPCACVGATCDPDDVCNRLLECATSDPTHGGICPISRRSYKQNISYLSEADLQRLHDDLLTFRLASYQYNMPGASPAPHLGFIIDDVAPSPSVAANGDTVDLYGYTSMAVAAVQTQAQEIEALKREVESLRGQIAESVRGSCQPRRTSRRKRAATP
nr:hypothetical protein Hi04_10k_c1000_00021 [uncultured bacterium]